MIKIKKQRSDKLFNNSQSHLGSKINQLFCLAIEQNKKAFETKAMRKII